MSIDSHKRALLITSQYNIKYLSGFTGSKATILKIREAYYFFTDSRYEGEASKVIPKSFHISIYKKGEFEEAFKKILKKHKVSKIHFEADHLTLTSLRTWRKLSSPAKLIPGRREIEAMRAKKTKEEIRLLTASQRINEQVFYSALKLLKTGVTEKEIAWKIRILAHDLGAEDLSFEPIIAFGKASAVPHHQNTNRKLTKGDMILVDMGVKYKGYCSDMTRTLFTKAPTAEQAKVYETVLNAQKHTINHLKTGITGHKAWRLAADIITSEGYGENFTHGLGHGTGLQIHESPSLAPKSRDKIEAGMIVTIEPGIYLPNKFGVRIEDMGVLTKSGFENFTKIPKELKDSIIKLK
ncbi:peptidase M24 family protein [Candidatus Peregrinibacteria bacterium CG22_combo_CG10-13_8_21_14_all_44_10]|nr:MAG: hypothetical protein AUK45_01630 [Candidatus Peregrinibacteria bacterium CG2_30_44_17]PIP66417.1 MAG: peptidase M24 family protein [Candidatus Peregrinibacteria bacterium CG22_combo_CG10-13_8_21_14_all_44_10]PIS03758.1 MAG: peptidase M24 family protein [Candidatus Peregrinibacteria bacterium CG10_big_fil_rev_8_21_14_0_10_44_7]PIX80028.1 MAG: peptidase M24 family protein [Candidatus Peregrinibacteria bacterium CG_4_10_14_3_um_filter_44_21]PJB89377.1 MAG: peptidase M24 family protein [Can